MTEVSPNSADVSSTSVVPRLDPDLPGRARRSRNSLAILDATSITVVLLFVTVVTNGWGALTEASPLLLGIVGGVVAITTLWWRNAYVMTRSVACLLYTSDAADE